MENLASILDVGWSHHTGVIDADIHVELVQFHVLLSVGVKKVVKLKASDRNYRRTVELGVVKTV